MTIKKRIRNLKRWVNHVIKKSHFRVPPLMRIKYALKGFNANEYIYYDLKKNDFRNYISDYERTCSRDMNGQYKFILDDKLIFEEIFRNYVRVPTVYAWVSDGNVYGLHGYAVDNENVIDFIRTLGRSVLKWENGYEGKGTFVISANSDASFDVNGHIKTESEVLDMFSYGKDTAILCEYMKQSAFSCELYPNATNTIRIICAKKKGEKTAHVIKAAQRIGNKISEPVDNVSAGAISCEIDIGSGTLMSGVIAKDRTGKRNAAEGQKFFSHHPDTGAQLEGRVIPNWEAVVKEVESVTNKFPYLNFIAWDVLLLDDGICFIEGNASSGLMMFQQRHGVRNEEIGDIYRSYGIIK